MHPNLLRTATATKPAEPKPDPGHGPSTQASPNAGPSPITIRFMDWQCGQRGGRPADIPCQSLAQAHLILQAVSRAISQPDFAYAAVFDDTRGISVYLTDDYIDSFSSLGEGNFRTRLYVGSQAEVNELRSAGLREALEAELGCIPSVWDGKSEIRVLECLAVMSEAEAQAATAPVAWREDHLHRPACKVPPIIKPLSELLAMLRTEAAAQAVEAGEFEPALQGVAT